MLASRIPKGRLFFEDDSAMNLEDSLIAYAVANGKNEIFLLIMALIMNAGVAGRGKRRS